MCAPVLLAEIQWWLCLCPHELSSGVCAMKTSGGPFADLWSSLWTFLSPKPWRLDASGSRLQASPQHPFDSRESVPLLLGSLSTHAACERSLGHPGEGSLKCCLEEVPYKTQTSDVPEESKTPRGLLCNVVLPTTRLPWHLRSDVELKLASVTPYFKY